MRSVGSSAFSRAWTRALGRLSAPHGAVWSPNWSRLGASAILLTYTLVAALAGVAVQNLGDLGIRPGPCGEYVCLDWVMPAGSAWFDGARPGMRVVTLNGRAPKAAVVAFPLQEAELVGPDGRSV